jgi:hypothetical protein
MRFDGVAMHALTRERETERSIPRQAETVVYIIGAGRSGSTFLDAVLGMHPEVVATGELRYFASLQDGGPRRCACGQLVADCPFWQAAVRLWTDRDGPQVVEEWVQSRNRYERLRGIPRLLTDLAFRPSKWRSYARSTYRLVASVREAGGGRIVADSSKSPVRAYLLTKVEGLQVVMLHLVRDPRGVAWSRMKATRTSADRPRPRALWRAVCTSLDWILVNLLAERAVRRARACTRFRYEDLALAPAEILAEIGRLLELDFDSVAGSVAAGHAIGYQHVVDGNPRRLGGPAALIFDQEWRSAEPAWLERLVWTLAAPLARRYGYRR